MIRAKIAIFVLFHAVLALAPLSLAGADEIDEQIQRAQKAYDEQQYREAIEELQFAISQIQEKLNAQYITLLPEPLPGWQADEAQATSAPVAFMGGGTQVSRRYYKDDGAEITIQILGDSPMLQAMSMLLTNPAMLASEPGTKPFRHGQYRGVMKQDRENGSAEIDLIVGNRVLVKIEAQNVADQGLLQDYLKAVDFKKIEAAMGD